MKKIKLMIADDHVVLRNGLAVLLSNLGYEVVYECGNGKDLINKLRDDNLPDLILMDINMPEMDGCLTTKTILKRFPSINVLALSMYDNEYTIIRMLKSGARGYIIKDADPMELKKAIEDILEKGFYYSEQVSGKLLHSIHQGGEGSNNYTKIMNLNEREIEFLKLASTEMTYKEIAQAMHLSPHTIDGYREALFEKLNIKNRVGLVLFAIRQNIVQVH